LEEELKELRESELWQSGKTVRSLRPENQKPADPFAHENKFEKVKFSSPLYRD
jgi:ketol-acid reductoisomerase